MHIDNFKQIVTTFADPGSEILFDKHRVLFSINGEVIDAELTSKSGDIYVNEGNGLTPAGSWIIKRLANLPLLSTRISERIPTHKNFVSPVADLLPTLEINADGTTYKINDALRGMLDSLESRSPLETTVMYVTSDAGEGKTSLINAAARRQAEKFSAGESDWLLVPIVLGGRHFLRFDDITVGALQNRYRFPFLYYNSFLALVRMGVIVPAFDGFEEMFVENSSGEALSAMGILVGALQSTGAVVVAARKAYFEFENLKSQEKLYDTINEYSVGFSKLEINRWEEKQFLQYCKNRSIPNGQAIYQSVAERLGSDHSLLTRPVLVRRLIDIAEQSNSLESFIEKVQVSGSDFFTVFVHGIIEREAIEKWIDRSGEMGSALLSVEEHCELLSMIAVNMWESRTEYLKQDLLDIVAEFFCEANQKSALQTQQVRDRIKGHALLVASSDVNKAVEFDHDEFRQYFLGDGLARITVPMDKGATAEALSVMRRGILPEHSQLAFSRAVKRNKKTTAREVAKFLANVSKLDGHASYTRENCGNLISRVISESAGDDLELEEIVFGIDALRDCKIERVNFKNCYFSQGSYELTQLTNCTFTNCTFGQIRVYDSTTITSNTFIECNIDSIRIESKSLEMWEPSQINGYLESLNKINTKSALAENIETEVEIDENLICVEKLLRYFMRSTHISESVIRIKLGDRGQHFIDNIIPELIEHGVVTEINDRSSAQQRRVKLGRPLQELNSSLAAAQGSYEKFLEKFDG